MTTYADLRRVRPDNVCMWRTPMRKTFPDHAKAKIAIRGNAKGSDFELLATKTAAITQGDQAD